MELPKLDLDGLRKISTAKKLTVIAVLAAAISGLFYYYVITPKYEVMTALQDNIGKLDADIQATAIKVQHLDELVAANKELEKELEKKKERLPPEEEAVTLLKQLSDLGVRLGLDIKLWKPGTHGPRSRSLASFRLVLAGCGPSPADPDPEDRIARSPTAHDVFKSVERDATRQESGERARLLCFSRACWTGLYQAVGTI